MEIKDKHHILSFGKYKGKTIKEIININPNYLIWCEKKEIIAMSKKLHSKVLIAVSKMHDYHDTSYSRGYDSHKVPESKNRKLSSLHTLTIAKSFSSRIILLFLSISNC